MTQKITGRDSLQNAVQRAEAAACIDWRFGMFIQFDIDTSHGPGQIGILSQNGTSGYTCYRYPDAAALATECSAHAPSDAQPGLSV